MMICGGSRWLGSWSNSESVEISVAELISSEADSESDAPSLSLSLSFGILSLERFITIEFPSLSSFQLKSYPKSGIV